MNYLLRRRGLGKTSCNAIKAGSTTGLEVVRSDDEVPAGNIVFRWGCTASIKADTIVNEVSAIHWVTNKRDSRMVLNEAGLCPKTWVSINAGVTFPCVVRPQFHHQGRHLYVCNNIDELEVAWTKVGYDGYISELIDKVAEYRVFVVSGRVPCVARKYPNKDGGVAWNVFQGGRFENVKWHEWPTRAIKASIEAFNLSGLDFGGVDVMVDAKGKAYILEINSAPSLTSPYRQKCMTKALDYIVVHGRGALPVGRSAGYKSFIHPAVEE